MELLVTNTIAGVRKALDITQADLSFRSGIERKRLGAIERQERECELAEALAISGALGLSVNDLFARSIAPCAWISKKQCHNAALNLIDTKFGYLKVKYRTVGTHKHRQEAFWFCECDCGGTAIVRSDHLRSGHTQSCGCRVNDNCLFAGNNSVRL